MAANGRSERGKADGGIDKWKALLRTGYHANFSIVVTGALYRGLPTTLAAGGTMVLRLAALYISFNVLLYGGIYTVNALVDLEEDKKLKPWRPLATGAVAVPTARVVAATLIIAGLGSGWVLGPAPAVPRLFGAFLGVNGLYSFAVRPLGGPLLAAHTVSVTAALRLALGAVGVGGAMPPLSALVAAWAAMTSVHISRKHIERSERPLVAEHAVTSAAMLWAFGRAWRHDGGFGPWYTLFVLYQHVGFGLLPALVEDSYQKLAAFYKTKTQ